MYHQLIVSLGSNIPPRKDHLQKAIDLIHQRIGLIAAISPVYETPAWGFSSAAFYNCCLKINTHHTPHNCLALCQEIERELGRFPKQSHRYEARTIDIDLLFYDALCIEEQQLILPHPLLHQRDFVLKPLYDIASDWIHPTFQHKVSDFGTINKEITITKCDFTLKNPKQQFDFSPIHFLTIEGNIGVGKTTLSKKISEDFRAKLLLESFEENPFLPKFYENNERYSFPLEMSFLASRYKQLQKHLGQYDLFNDFIVSDYYIYKSLLFAKVTLPEDEFQLYENIFNIILQQINKPNLYVYLHQDADQLLDKIKKRGREYEQKIPTHYLEQISKQYAYFIKTLPEKRVLIIDVSSLDFVANQSDYLQILALIHTKIDDLKA